MKIDKKESMPEYAKQFEKVQQLLNKEFEDSSSIGICYKIWARKKYLLKTMYNIDWSSPAELNPTIKFD